MDDSLTLGDLDVILDALRWSKRTLEDRPIESTDPSDPNAQREAYLAKREKLDRLDMVILKVDIRRDQQEERGG